ncbi:MAG: 3-oxoacyl-ACP reductase FabG [Rhodospirillaceae bacterium]|nr:3-oxoacyl-ACP reductase FabG [Rhodospirillaceae bacterium]
MARLQNRVAIITGGAQGIGAAYARGFAAEGANVVIADVAPADAVIDEIKSAGGTVIATRTDVTDEAACADMAARTIDAFGRIDILVNNAALWVHIAQKPIMEISKAEWDRVLDVNINGMFLCTKAVVPQMTQQGYGKIINISSGRALKGLPNLLHYDTSKGAVISFTRSVARELGDSGIRANTIAPGGIMTDNVVAQEELRGFIALGTATRAIKREQVPEDVVGACIFLASEESDFVTGQVLAVDGGSAMN